VRLGIDTTSISGHNNVTAFPGGIKDAFAPSHILSGYHPTHTFLSDNCKRGDYI